jgi:hypothetical protein
LAPPKVGHPAAFEFVDGDNKRHRSVRVALSEQIFIWLVGMGNQNLHCYNTSFNRPKRNEREPEAFLSVRTFYERFPQDWMAPACHLMRS